MPPIVIAFNKEIMKICQEYGYDLEVLPNVLECAAAVLNLLSNKIYEEVK